MEVIQVRIDEKLRDILTAEYYTEVDFIDYFIDKYGVKPCSIYDYTLLNDQRSYAPNIEDAFFISLKVKQNR